MSVNKEKTMKSKRLLLIIIVLLVGSSLSACNLPAPANANMPNPAAQFCESRGFIYQIRSDAAGNQYGVCIYSSDDECDAWAYYQGECEPQVDPTLPPTAPTELPAPTGTALPELETYRDDTFRFELTYPPTWNLQASSLGDFTPQSTLLQLSRDNWLFSIHVKRIGDHTVTGGGLGAGDIQSFDPITILGSGTQGNSLHYENKIKSIWYAAETTDLEIYAKLDDSGQGDYSAIQVSDEIIQDVKNILESLIRTGEPLPTPRPTSFFAPTETPLPLSCNMNPQLIVGSQAQITPGLPNTLRSSPGRESDSSIIGSIPSGGIIDVLDGPVCKSGYNWWKVEYGSLVGWTAEGFGGTYWILTYQSSGEGEDPESEEVDGWVGVVVSAEDLPQVDDYFQMMDQNGSRYGIHSLDADLREALEDYRDTGTALKIWGTLYRGRMDAYNTQIEVTSLEEF
jgi:putative hemolysin